MMLAKTIPLIHNPPLLSPMEPLPKNQENLEIPKPKLKPLHWDKVGASFEREWVPDYLDKMPSQPAEKKSSSDDHQNEPNGEDDPAADHHRQTEVEAEPASSASESSNIGNDIAINATNIMGVPIVNPNFQGNHENNLFPSGK
ncbi:hypothetical protein L1987_18082 [Smallanthus sonchifolius]|uniref:Uncharacterized protein n=1 Tax=Smallanthus sonchifolius TaxID=185202 RepID=A0ACB9IZB1_9ASTR|nr:hypothetical protein L1987_18082 [Smallanthus sonchifolius]